jgi:hypothetical protein
MAWNKAGVGRSTSAEHSAACLIAKAKTVRVDGDSNRFATLCVANTQLPFEVGGAHWAALNARHPARPAVYTKARLEPHNFKSLALGCHLQVQPCTPDRSGVVKTLILTVSSLKEIGANSLSGLVYG